jgi:hypothetical protein
MNSTPPPAIAPAAIAPTSGHTLGSFLALVCAVGLLRPEHRVGQCDRVDFAGIGILQQVGIDKEHDPHVLAFPGAEILLVKAEALQLVEIDAGLGRGNVEGRLPGDALVRAVDRAEKHFALLAGMHLDLADQRAEFPGEVVRRRRIEADGDHGFCDIRRGGRGALRRPAIAGSGAEQPVERHRGEAEPYHAGDHREQQHDGCPLAAMLGRRHLSPRSSARW